MRLNENIAYAKSILNKNGIDKDSDEYNDYLRIREICGRNNGYVGILTKLRFIDDVSDMDEIESIFNLLKDSNINVNKLNKLSYNEILEIFYEELSGKVDKSDVELIYKDNQYSYYRVYTHKGILKMGSPAWCLKTKSNWDQYQEKYPEQWVIVDNRHKKSLLSPDSNYLENYSNLKKPWIRYGISVKNNGGSVSWIGNDDNNGEINMKPQSWTFFGVICTLVNLVNNNNKSYYDSFAGCEKVNKAWHKVVNKDRFLNRMKMSKYKFNQEDELYVKFSKSYSFLPVILILNTYGFRIVFPTDKKHKGDTIFNKTVKLSSKYTMEVILDYIKDKNDIYFDGIKLNNDLVTIEDIKNKTTKSGKKQFLDQLGKWLIYDRNEHYYLIVNTDVDELEISTHTFINYNYEMENPIAWYIDKSKMKPEFMKEIKDFHKQVIEHIKNNLQENVGEKEIENKPEEKKVKSFWNFFKK